MADGLGTSQSDWQTLSVIVECQHDRHATSIDQNVMRGDLLLVCCILGSLLTACNKPSEPTKTAHGPTPAIAQQNNKELEDRMRNLQLNFLSLEQRVRQIESGQTMVSTDEEGYSIVNTKFGPFTVKGKSVKPYLDGFKVTLVFGNLTTAIFDGANISVSWGQPIGGVKFDGNSKQFKVNRKFPSGSWTDVELSLTPAKPDQVKMIFVGIEFDRVSLLYPKSRQ